MSRSTPSLTTAILRFIFMTFFVGAAVGPGKTAPTHQMLKPAAQPVPPYNTDPVSGMRTVLCVIFVLVPTVLHCLNLFQTKFLDWVVSDM